MRESEHKQPRVGKATLEGLHAGGEIMGSRSGSGSGSGNEGNCEKAPPPPRYFYAQPTVEPSKLRDLGSDDKRDTSPLGGGTNGASSSLQTYWAPEAGGSDTANGGGCGDAGSEPVVARGASFWPPPPPVASRLPVSNLSAPSVAFPSPVELNSRKYLKPPPKRKGAAQALIWNFMLPYSSADGQRTVECCILVPCETTGGMRKCGATFKHKMGGSTTNLLKHLRRRHPDEANRCMEARRQQGSGLSAGGAAPSSGPSEEDCLNRGVDIWDGGPAARAFSLFCAIDLQPPTVSADPGLMQHLNRHASPQPADRDMFQEIVLAERKSVSRYITSMLDRQRASISFGPCCALQLSVWKAQDSGSAAFAVATTTFVNPAFEMRRVGLDVREFQQGFTAKEVCLWVKSFTADYFQGMTPKQVYVACTLGDGNELESAMEELAIPCVQCKLTKLQHTVEESLMLSVHHSGQSSALGRLLRKAREAASAITRPVREGSSDLAALQSAIGKDFLCSAQPNSLRAVLHLFMTLLHRRPQIEEHLKKAVDAPPFSIDDNEWSLMCDAVGVLEACAEIERSVPSADAKDEITSLPAMLVLLQELQDYLRDELLFVPELNKDMDSHRVEKAASSLDTGLQSIRASIAENLAGEGLGHIGGRVERVAALLDVSQKGILLAGSEEEAKAWGELSAEYRSAAFHRLNLAGGVERLDDGASSAASSSDHHGKRKWGGALQARKKQRWMACATGLLETTAPPAEVETYRTMLLLLPQGAVDPLAWWSGRDNTTCSAGGSRVAQLPLLSLLFSQYYAVDSCSTQASTLLREVGYRVTGLRQFLSSTCIEDMMYLRLNRGLLQEAAAAAAGGEAPLSFGV